jgi:hypothetical protein
MVNGPGGDGPRDSGESEGTEESPQSEWSFARWFLLDGRRWFIVALISLAVLVVVIGLGRADVIGVTEQSLVTGIFTASITGVFTLVSITITINQLVLSRILGSPELIQERIDATHEFRTNVQEMVPEVDVSPTEPAAFLEVVLHALADRTHRLDETFAESHDADLQREVTDVVETLLAITVDGDGRIRSDRLGMFRVLSPILNNEFSQHINTVRRVRVKSDQLSTDEERALDDLEEVLVEINRTRHYFKTLYLHEELADLSRKMLLTGIPAILVSFLLILSYDGAILGVSEQVQLLAVSGAIVVVLLPLSVLVAGRLRFITIAKRTTTFGTFTPPEEMP